jgi:hypothetical protein
VMSPIFRTSAATVPATCPVPYTTMKGPQLFALSSTAEPGLTELAELCAAGPGQASGLLSFPVTHAFCGMPWRE